jgi:hypothetical protein
MTPENTKILEELARDLDREEAGLDASLEHYRWELRQPQPVNEQIKLGRKIERHELSANLAQARAAAIREALAEAGNQRAAFEAGWNAHETGYSASENGRAEALAVFLNGSSIFNDEEEAE